MRKMLFITVLVLVSLGMLNLLKVKKIICQTNIGECSDYQLNYLQQTFVGQKILFNDLLTQRASLPWQILEFKKILPTTLQVMINANQLTIQLESNGQYWVMSKDGQLISVQKKPLPTIIVSPEVIDLIKQGSLSVDQIDSLAYVGEWIQTHAHLNPKFEWQNNHTIVLQLTDLSPVYINPQTIKLDLTDLDLIMKRLDLQNFDQPIQLVDLRFNLPILKTKLQNISIHQSNTASDSAEPVATESADMISTFNQ